MEQKGILDPSVQVRPGYFQLNAEYVQPVEEKPKLHADASRFELKATKIAPLLQAKITSDASALDTREHDVSAPLGFNLAALLPEIAPDMQRQLNAKLERANKQLDGNATMHPLLEPGEERAELAPRSVPSRPPIAPPLPAQTARAPETVSTTAPVKSVDLSPLLGAGRQPRDLSQQGIKPNPVPGGMLSTAGVGGGIVPPGAGTAMMPTAIDAPPPVLPKPAAQPAKAPLSAVPNQSPKILPIPRTQARMQLPVPHADTACRDLLAQVSSVNAQLRKNDLSGIVQPSTQLSLPQAEHHVSLSYTAPKAPTLPGVAANVAKENIGRPASDLVIPWDDWHRRFAVLAKQPLHRLVQTANATGRNTVIVTVTRTHHVSVRVLGEGKSAFDQAVKKAYESLDGDARLQFPAGSHRTSVSFHVDNQHVVGDVIDVRSSIAAGDREIVPYSP